MEAANKPAVSRKSAVATSLCTLACLFILSAALLVAVGYSPFEARTAPWDRFATVQKAAASAPRPASPPPGVRRHDAGMVRPDPGLEDQGGAEDTGGLAPAPAPAAEGDAGECDLFNGDWVRDDDEAWYPLYEAAECPFLSDQVACRRNGRPDYGYEQWRWRPRGCAGRTRMGGAEALALCRDKRLVFVGDSLNRNMWESLSCILYAAVPDRSRTRIIEDAGAEIFRAMDYNCSVEFFWSPFLVNLETKSNGTRALKLDQLPPILQRTLGADVLVYNTGHWWTHTGKLKAWDHLEKNGKKVEMAGGEAFNRALRTWARWIDHNVDQSRTRVFFRSVSPEHKWTNWCHNQTLPIVNGTIASWFPESMVTIVERNIEIMRTPVTYLNITQLSKLRIDAHPSIYTVNREGKPLSREERQQPIKYGDCSHWCLPGLPDTWNVLLLTSLRIPPSNVHLLG